MAVATRQLLFLGHPIPAVQAPTRLATSCLGIAFGLPGTRINTLRQYLLQLFFRQLDIRNNKKENELFCLPKINGRFSIYLLIQVTYCPLPFNFKQDT